MTVAAPADVEVLLDRSLTGDEQDLVPLLLVAAEAMVTMGHPTAVADAETDVNLRRAVLTSEASMVFAVLRLGDTTTRARINDWRFTQEG